jgi:hypothetical protein
MALPATPHCQFSDDTVWDSLKRAIANSSGFQRWHAERISKGHLQDLSQEQLVSRYLRETLETLAY